jgi:cathepsin L
MNPTLFAYIQYIAKYGKSHIDMQDFHYRLGLFESMERFIEEHNASGKKWTVAHNHLSDLSTEEYRSLLGYKMSSEHQSNVVLLEETNADTVNWVTAGGVTKVKDQGQCGSCWSFSTTGSMEGAHFVASGELLSFSEQQLVDCAYGSQYGSYGCNGGSMDGAMVYYQTYNAETEETYPYTSGTDTARKSCQYSASQDTDVADKTKTDVLQNNVAQMKAAVAQQPVSVAIEADQRSFQSYSSGILDSGCGTNLDHGVLVVGYGSDSGEEYWLVKNSWNTWWGDQGYIKIAIQDGAGVCGIQMAPVYPTTN